MGGSFSNPTEAKNDLAQFNNAKLSDKQIVKNKLMKLYGALPDAQLDTFADALSNPETLKAVYLHTDFEQAQRLQKTIKDLRVSTTTATATATTPDDDTDSSIGGANNDSNHGGMIKFDPYADMKNHIRIKLVVSETGGNLIEKNVKRLISPFISFDNFNAPFGFVHIALCIGAWRLEWNMSELVIPRTVQGNASLVAADIESIATLDRLDVVRDQIAKCIVKWNTSYLYRQTGGNNNNNGGSIDNATMTTTTIGGGEETLTPTSNTPPMNSGMKYGNCQQFIDDCLQVLGIDMSSAFPPPLRSYLNKLRTNGHGEMEFLMDDEFKKTFFGRSGGSIPPSTPPPLANMEIQTVSPHSQNSHSNNNNNNNNNNHGGSDEVTLDDETMSTMTSTNHLNGGFNPSKYRKKKRIKFRTHAELDQFMHYLLKVEPEFQFRYKYEYYLLKSFDRAFWMRALSSNFENGKFVPCVDSYGVNDCPFGDPRDASLLELKLRRA